MWAGGFSAARDIGPWLYVTLRSDKTWNVGTVVGADQTFSSRPVGTVGRRGATAINARARRDGSVVEALRTIEQLRVGTLGENDSTE